MTPLLRRNALLQQSLHGEAVPGIWRRTLAWGERTMVLESTFEAGAQLQAHSQPHEQTTYVVSGELEITPSPRRYTRRSLASTCTSSAAGRADRAGPASGISS